jgi:hypothetical protein
MRIWPDGTCAVRCGAEVHSHRRSQTNGTEWAGLEWINKAELVVRRWAGRHCCCCDLRWRSLPWPSARRNR